MSTKALYPIVFVAVLASGGARAACTYPTAPGNLPDGNTATRDAMMAAQKSVKDFDVAVTNYTACLQAESDAQIAGLEQSETDIKKRDQQKEKLTEVLIKKQNAAVDADKALAKRFNEQVRIFKAKSSGQ